MKTAVFAALLASAAAFAPVKQVSKSSTALSAFEDELGVQPPLGYFDPLGMLNNASESRFKRLRETEIKHGRISMLAVAGYLYTLGGNRLPGDLTLSGTKFSDIPSGFAALGALPKAGLTQLFIFIFFLEMVVRQVDGYGEFPGDYRNGSGADFGWSRWDEETQLKKRAIELNNGRAAMMGILGLMVHEQLGNLDAIIPFSK